MKKILYICMSMTTLVGCGKKAVVSSRKTPIIAPIGKLSEMPQFFKKHNSSCINFQGTRLVYEMPFNIFQYGALSKKTLSLSSLLDKTILRDQQKKIISNSFYDEKLIVSENSEGLLVTSDAKAIELFICPEDESFDADTIESVGLNAAYFIQKTYKKFDSLGTGVSLPSIELNVMPSIMQKKMSRGELRDHYWTDNAFYNPYARAITFLPHSWEWMRKTGANFWDIPLVSSHEYGHHIFQSIFGLIGGEVHKNSGCFGHTGMTSLLNESMNETRKVTSLEVMGAYNEGFADLVSFYTLDEDELSLDGVYCLEVSRDINSSTFRDNAPKVFSASVLETFFSTSYDHRAGRSCEDTDYQGIHSIGAIFAYSTDQFLSQLTTSRDEKYKILVDWVMHLKRNKNKYQNMEASTFLQKSFAQLLRQSLDRFGKKFDDASCSDAERLFTGIRAQIPECSLK